MTTDLERFRRRFLSGLAEESIAVRDRSGRIVKEMVGSVRSREISTAAWAARRGSRFLDRAGSDVPGE
jgi:hypothetical protein